MATIRGFDPPPKRQPPADPGTAPASRPSTDLGTAPDSRKQFIRLYSAFWFIAGVVFGIVCSLGISGPARAEVRQLALILMPLWILWNLLVSRFIAPTFPAIRAHMVRTMAFGVGLIITLLVSR